MVTHYHHSFEVLIAPNYTEAHLPHQIAPILLNMPGNLAISSMSLGRCYAGHDLAHRLSLAQQHGYEGIEVFYEDLADLAARSSSNQSLSDPSPESLVKAAQQLRQMCTERSLEVVCLQPFMNFEGLLDRAEHKRRLEELELWFELANTLSTDLIAIPSSILPAEKVSDDLNLIVSDLREAADLALQASPPIRLSYESLSWGTRSDTWEKSWDIVKRVDRPNFGVCLDTFNIAGRIFADPTSPTGRTPDSELAVKQSIDRLVSEVDVDKVFIVQVVDAAKLEQPLVKGHPLYNAEQPARMSWSRNCRLFYGETERGAYLPVLEIASAIFNELGYHGWISLELFNSRMSDTDPDVPEELAQRGALSFAKLQRDLQRLAGSHPA